MTFERQVASTIDTFDREAGLRRSIIFYTEDGLAESRIFDDDSMVIICSPTEIYDWYGRKVILGEGIDSVINKFGSEYNGKSAQCASQLFIVRKTNGKLGIGGLNYECVDSKTADRLPWYKQVLLGGLTGRNPSIDLKTGFEFDSFDEEAQNQPIIQVLQKLLSTGENGNRLAVLYGVSTKNSPELKGTAFLSTVRHALKNFERNVVYQSRRDANSNGVRLSTSTYVFGNLEFSDNGNKMSAISPCTHLDSRTRISIDIETIKNCAFGNILDNIPWYLDD